MSLNLDPTQLSELTGQLSEGIDLQSITDLVGTVTDRN